jgi:cbb3-type cytochrome oxidase subunit 3
MKLSDIMSAAGLTSWAEIGLIISFVTFAAVVAYVFIVRSKDSYEEERHLPLEDGEGCQVRRFRRFAGEESNITSAINGKSSESSDLAPPEVSS